MMLLISALFITACTKTYLDKKPDQALVVPQTLQDLQALLDNTGVMNTNMPSLQEVSSDDYYITSTAYNSLTVLMYKNAYTWNKDIYAGSPDVLDWNNRYKQIFYSNVVLEGLAKMNATEKASAQFAAEKGSALFYRGFALYQLAQLFCKPYNAVTAASDLGVPVRTSSDINRKSSRATVAQAYTQIIADLKESLNFLPQTVNIKTRPNLTAANGLLARVYLSMNDHANALKYADAALKQYSTLLDYNKISTTSSLSFARYNDEVIFLSTLISTSMSNVSRLLIDTTLYKCYTPGDLRLKLFFKAAAGGNTYKGSYSGSSTFFNGVATDELYLIRAECYAMQNDKAAALADLNKLMATRWKTGTFVPYSATSANDALSMILLERRKELLFRGLRWTDLRRLNMENGRETVLKRNINGAVYTFPPNNERYVLPIPDLVIQLSGIQQNPR